MSALRGPRDMPGMEGYLKGCRRVLRRARADQGERVPPPVVRARQVSLGSNRVLRRARADQGERVRRACAPVCLCESRHPSPVSSGRYV